MNKSSSNYRQVLLGTVGAVGCTAALLVSQCADLPASPQLRDALSGSSAALALLYSSIAIEGLVGTSVRSRLTALVRRWRALMH